MKSYSEFRKEVINNSTSCVKNTQEILNKLDNAKETNYFLEINNDALKLAEESDKYYQKGKPRPLEGMLVGVKDNISVKGMKATCGSKMLANYSPVYDATAIKRIKDAGGILICKTNMDELAMGSSGETSYFGKCKNPYNDEYITGGSSSGSAAVVATSLVHTALGSDTGGSIRLPAAFCGVVGLKPTYGSISRYGMIPFASSLDQMGTISANVDDTALLFDAISGIDDNDSTTSNTTNNTFNTINEPLPNNFKVGLLPDDILKNCKEDILKAYSKSLDKLKTMGAEFKVLNFDFIDICVPAYIVLTTIEASSNLARLDSVRYGHRTEDIDNEEYMYLSRGEGFGIEVKRRLLLGTYYLTNDDKLNAISKAKKIRQMVKRSINTAFSDIDIMFMPTTATTAFKCNERSDDPVSMYLSDFFTTSANLSGVPAISIPVGFNDKGLPIGMQIQVNSGEEAKLFKYAKAIME
ncbi:MAG: Asp-tRNA(Asn)/Glu-tRNA(Gln) amidotransferase subunit GatA [Bacteroidetes bacterium]|nr:Asp-tRNA(Asn)/Glu-tRNA(Gln) amidotransferase subunit GatA [Bacteroidota bacterium]